MHIRIERGGSSPISRQIVDQIRAQCLSGILRPGDCLPSVRQLAGELVVNVNTIVRVYERLAAEGLVETRQGEGSFVLPVADKSKNALELKEQREQLSREFQSLVRRGIMLGFSTAELRQLVTHAAEDKHTSQTRTKKRAENQ